MSGTGTEMSGTITVIMLEFVRQSSANFDCSDNLVIVLRFAMIVPDLME